MQWRNGRDLLTNLASEFTHSSKNEEPRLNVFSFDRYIEQHQDIRVWKDSLQKAYKKVEMAIEPLLHGWLQNPNDGECILRHTLDEAWPDGEGRCGGGRF